MHAVTDRPVRHGRRKSRGAFATIASVVAIAVAVAIVSGGSVAAIAVWNVAKDVKPGVHLSTLSGHTRAPIPEVGAIAGGVNLLLTGTDTRTGQGGVYSSKQELAGSSGVGNNDVNILLHIAQDHKSVTVVSFPRDLEIPVPACPLGNGHTRPGASQVMLNTTLSRGGLSCTVLTIEKLTGVDIPFAAEISFDGVSAMSDAVGGVTVCLATPVNDRYTTPPLALPAGQQTLVGPVALSFLRSRHGVGDGSDLGRISNQQVFMSALARKLTSAGVLSNPLTLYSLASATVKNVTLSDTLTSPVTLVQIGLALKTVGLSNMVFVQYPTIYDPSNKNRVIPQQSGAAVLNSALVQDKPVTLTGTTGVGSVAGPSTPPTSTGTPTPTATTDPNSVALPSTVTGQTAAQETCTKGKSR
jgi:LCP family protein required for cell wall assembly